jgi:hypothetical protein
MYSLSLSYEKISQVGSNANANTIYDAGSDAMIP